MKMKSGDIRDSYKQKKYREQSQSTNKSNQHVAHYFSLNIAAVFNEYVEPPVPKEDMKYLCNQDYNLRMVNIKTNKSTHTQIDNALIKSFKHKILATIKEQQYMNLLKKNPTALVEKLKLKTKQRYIEIELKLQNKQRARAQVKRIQKLDFPHRYQAFARLVYLCFTDSKKRVIWDDRENKASFNEYLKKHKTIQFDDDEKDPINDNDDNGKDEDNKYETVGNDDTKHSLIKGKRGGTYYLNKYGRKVYVYNGKDAVFRKDDKGRNLYKGSRGGTYYLFFFANQTNN